MPSDLLPQCLLKMTKLSPDYCPLQADFRACQFWHTALCSSYNPDQEGLVSSHTLAFTVFLHVLFCLCYGPQLLCHLLSNIATSLTSQILEWPFFPVYCYLFEESQSLCSKNPKCLIVSVFCFLSNSH